MLSVDKNHRRKGVATRLVKECLDKMVRLGADEVLLETEVDNIDSLRLYQRLGFVKEKRLYSFYLNGELAIKSHSVGQSQHDKATADEIRGTG